MIDISKYDKADVLVALYNNSKVQGMGFLQARSGPMDYELAVELLKDQSYFDYLFGKVMKVELSCDEFDPWLYDRDNGDGAALRAIHTLDKEAESGVER